MNLSVRDAARLLGVSEKTVYRWAREGEVPFLRVNEQYRFSRAELLQWLTARRVGVSPAEKESGLRTRRAPTPSFGFVATGPGFHVWEETRAEALRTARDLSRGAPVSAVRPPRTTS